MTRANVWSASAIIVGVLAISVPSGSGAGAIVNAATMRAPAAPIVLEQTPSGPTLYMAPRGISFGPSPDHAVLEPNGAQRVTDYRVRFTSTQCVMPAEVNLGKPTPANGIVLITPFAPVNTMPVGCAWTMILVAKGPAGEGVTAPIGPFARTTGQVPAAGTNFQLVD